MSTKWILLAEDNPNDADLAMRALTGQCPSHEVVLVSDGEAALDCLYRRGSYETRPSNRPACVLLDLKMPKVDGLEVLRQVKADHALNAIPVVVFTSSREEQDLIRSYRLGANAYVVKPVEFRQFLATLQSLHAFWLSINEPPPDQPPPDGPKPSLQTPVAA
jgi:CheY-like chemotaxis protein